MAGNIDVPADMMEKILLRLPVKSLLRFKCVCKHWFSLIGTRSFADRHFRQEKSDQDCLLLIDMPVDENQYFSMYPDKHDEVRIPYYSDKTLYVLGPTKGFFCEVREDGTIILSNLAMREIKTLPQLPLLSDHPLLSLAFGFGLDPLNGDYKIVAFPQIMSNINSALCVYNSTTHSWKHINEGVGNLVMNSMPHARWTHEQSLILNGVYYWLVRFNHDRDFSILAFDMISEEFRELIQVPDRCLRFTQLRLAVYDDSVALMSYEVGERVDLWVMVNKLWKRSVRVGPFEDMVWPLCGWKNKNHHELLLETRASRGEIIMCDLSTKKVRIVQLRPQQNKPHGVCIVVSYKESLVSIKGIVNEMFD